MIFTLFHLTLLSFVKSEILVIQHESNTKCFQGTLEEVNKHFKILSDLVKQNHYDIQFKKLLSHPNHKGCLPIYSQKKLQHQDVVESIAESFRYGTWCGINYGGFDGNCSLICEAQMSSPSEECIKCATPIDWTDAECMYHDFCVERFQVYKVGQYEGDACEGKLTLGAEFPEPCRCPMNLTAHLSYKVLEAKCPDLACISAGMTIRTAFLDTDLRCGCGYLLCNIDGETLVREDEGEQQIPEGCVRDRSCKTVKECYHKIGQSGQQFRQF